MQEFNDEDILETQQPEVESTNSEVDTIDPRLQAALDSQRKQRLMSDILRGFQQALQGSAPNSGFKADFSMADTLEKRSNDPIEQYKTQLQQEALSKKTARDEQEFKMRQESEKLRQDDFQLKLAASKLNFQDMEANANPSSPQSKVAQDRVLEMQKKLGQPINEQQIRSQSGAQLFKLFDYLKEDLTNFYKNENARLDREQQDKQNQMRSKMEEERNKKLDAMEQRRINREARQEEEGGKRAYQQQINTARDFLLKDPTYKKAQEQLYAFGNVNTLLDQVKNEKNQAAIAPLGSQLARAFGEVGVLTDTDVVRYMGTTAWGRNILDWWKKGAQGELSENTLKDLAKNIDSVRAQVSKVNEKIYNNAFLRARGTYPLDKFPEMSDDTINAIIGDPRYLEKMANKISSQPDMVKMISPDGKTRLIPKDQVEAAKKAGGRIAE